MKQKIYHENQSNQRNVQDNQNDRKKNDYENLNYEKKNDDEKNDQ